MSDYTVNDVYGKVLEVHEDLIVVKETALSLRSDFINLSSHVNDELETLRVVVDRKLDREDLLHTLVLRLLQPLLRPKILRWMMGVVAFTTVAAFASTKWLPLLERILHVLFG